MTISESDWKYLRKINPEILNEHYHRINEATISIAKSESLSESDKYLQIHKHLQASDKMIADCFDDWRRSTIFTKLCFLRQHGLLTSEKINNLSLETRERLQMIEEMNKE